MKNKKTEKKSFLPSLKMETEQDRKKVMFISIGVLLLVFFIFWLIGFKEIVGASAWHRTKKTEAPTVTWEEMKSEFQKTMKRIEEQFANSPASRSLENDVLNQEASSTINSLEEKLEAKYGTTTTSTEASSGDEVEDIKKRIEALENELEANN